MLLWTENNLRSVSLLKLFNSLGQSQLMRQRRHCHVKYSVEELSYSAAQWSAENKGDWGLWVGVGMEEPSLKPLTGRV